MTLEQYAYVAEIVGVIVIVVTLLYLAIQTKQNTAAVRTQSAQAILQAVQSELAALVENPGIALSIPMSGPLTPEQNVILDAWFASNMRNREFAWLQFTKNTINDSNWEAEVAILRVYSDSRRFRAWWNKLGRHYISEEFAQFVDGLIEDSPATDELWALAANWSSE